MSLAEYEINNFLFIYLERWRNRELVCRRWWGVWVRDQATRRSERRDPHLCCNRALSAGWTRSRPSPTRMPATLYTAKSYA